MAIAYNSATGAFASGVVSLTFAHTITGSDTILFVGATGVDFEVVTGVTYAGTAMTLITKKSAVGGTNNTIYLYYLINPTTGNNNVVISRSGTGYIGGVSASYTGVKQSSQPDAYASSTNTLNTSITQTVTSIANNCWGVAICGIQRTPVESTGCIRRSLAGTWDFGIFDTNSAITPAGVISMTQTFADLAADAQSGIIVSFAPLTMPTTAKSIPAMLLTNVG